MGETKHVPPTEAELEKLERIFRDYSSDHACVRMLAEIRRLREINRRLVEALDGVGFVAPQDSDDRVTCPWCGGFDPAFDLDGGHRIDCERQAALAAAKEIQ